MHQVVVLAVKAVNGGLFVVAFAVVAQCLKPKRFAGLLSAAPSVAIANLIVDIVYCLIDLRVRVAGGDEGSGTARAPRPRAHAQPRFRESTT